uniref:Uncharacterized protein n=1 Tax=Esox lucius TaxID=8010 RepID=A0A3P8XEG8_ESOLU
LKSQLCPGCVLTRPPSFQPITEQFLAVAEVRRDTHVHQSNAEWAHPHQQKVSFSDQNRGKKIDHITLIHFTALDFSRLLIQHICAFLKFVYIPLEIRGTQKCYGQGEVLLYVSSISSLVLKCRY